MQVIFTHSLFDSAFKFEFPICRTLITSQVACSCRMGTVAVGELSVGSPDAVSSRKRDFQKSVLHVNIGMFLTVKGKSRHIKSLHTFTFQRHRQSATGKTYGPESPFAISQDDFSLTHSLENVCIPAGRKRQSSCNGNVYLVMRILCRGR